MPDPLAICIEDLSPAPSAPRFVRCVAVGGRQPGLRLARDGGLMWKSDDGAACELWVSGDERLILYRPEGAEPVSVSRAGRSIQAPHGKPVVLVDADEVEVCGRRFRVHVHGKAPSIHEPSPLADTAWGVAAKVAAVMAMSAAMTGCNVIDIRERPPDMVDLPRDAAPPATTSAPPPPPPTPEAAPPSTIEVRDKPPIAAPYPVPPGGSARGK